MNLPNKIPMKECMHGHGRKGSAMYVLVDELDLGIVQVTTREAGNKPFKTLMMFRWLPDETFDSANALGIRLTSLTDEAIAAEKAKWPVLAEVKPDLPMNKCLRHRDRKSSVRAMVHTCWIPMVAEFAGLCQECAPKHDKDAQAVLSAIEERRAYVASLPPIRERLGLKS